MSENKGMRLSQRATIIVAVVVVLAIVGGIFYLTQPPANKTQLIVSTTTSLYETGFLDYLKTNFEAKYPQYTVSFISQGTGLALATAARGDADLVFVHDPGREAKFFSNGTGVDRKIVAYNYFIIVGPASDPAHVKGLNAVDAMKKIMACGNNGTVLWVSRGDGSGTESKEKSLWTLAGTTQAKVKAMKAPDGSPWYLSAGAGMTATLQLANQKNAYTISDMASYLKNKSNNNIQLIQVVEPEPNLLNVYSVIICNPATNPRHNFNASLVLEKFMASVEGQALFANFGVKDYGQAIFSPWITTLKANTDTTLILQVQAYAYINGSDCPTQYRVNAGDLYN